MKRIGFAFNPTSADALELREHGLAWCAASDIEAWALPSDQTPSDPGLLEATEAIVVLGGDGTFLRAAHVVADVGVPLVGVNLGKVGFLSKVENHALEDLLGQLQAGDYELEPRLMLQVRVHDAAGNEVGEPHVALNEAAVVRGGRVQVMRLQVDVGDSRMATYTSDGVVVASPTGSTGYSFSAGGPIIEPTSRNLVVTPIAAYLTPLRSSVVGPQHAVTVTVEAAHDCLLSIDGRIDVPLEVGSQVEVAAREKPITFLQPRGALPFWDLLRQKATLLPG
ncbi:MAG: NAD(+)/NADH kinase [Candidatus Limnocylindrales bacterium]